MSHYHLPHNHGQNIERVLERMPPPDGFHATAATFQQLGGPSRLRILWLLCHSEECVCNIAAAVGMSDPAVSHHLRILKKSGIIESRRDAQGRNKRGMAVNQLCPVTLYQICDCRT